MERVAHLRVTEETAPVGKWKTAFGSFDALHLELGCGKGRFTRDTALTAPTTLHVALERVEDALVVAMERSQDLANTRFMSCDAVLLTKLFAPREVDRIYINFCDPWPGKKRAKRRLTHPNFLKLYREVLAPQGEIHFKTDNLPLFEYSLETFAECGFDVTEVTNDLHASGVNGVLTDYEARFVEQGTRINRCVATVR
jgi:tRNA (guanine-N7-)-methyltransferase